MTGDALRIQDLRRNHDGRAVLDAMSFSVPRGSICAMVGPNGAGKTTTLRAIMGLTIVGGSIEVLGVAGRMRAATLRRVAFVPETKELYPFARVGEVLRLVRSFYPTWDHTLERRLIAELDIPLNSSCRSLSKGGATRVWLLLALCRGAELLILDEAADGLDPVVLDLLQRLLIQQVADRGATVLFSTHQLADVEQIADHIVIVDHGRCVIEGPLDDIRQRYRIVRLAMADDAMAPPSPLARWQRDGRFLTGLSADDPIALVETLPAGVQLINTQPASLKDVFLAQIGR